MANPLSDGTLSWLGGMDTSRSPVDIQETQYHRAANVILPDDMSGLKVRFGFHHVFLKHEDTRTRKIYESGHVQGEGWFESNGRIYLVAVVDGYVFKFTPRTLLSYYSEIINPNDRNSSNYATAWVTRVPNGCIICNGFDFNIYITATTQKRLDPVKGELPIGRMGIYVQNRTFLVDQSGKTIIAGDFQSPITYNEYFDSDILGFMAPDADEEITAIGKQKTILTYVEGGNLIFSTNKDTYAVDVRGSRSTWGDLSSGIGKVNETIPGMSAVSAYSFESFNANVYFRSVRYGLADLRQSEQQFNSLDVSSNQAIEASYFFDNDTDWMLYRCYTRACNKRLFTTVSPARREDGSIYWNGILSYYPSALYKDQTVTPRRFESVFTGVRPWCLTVVQMNAGRDQMFVHSSDLDGVNRLYLMREDTDFDVDQFGNSIEIQGWIETRGYQYQSPYLLKTGMRRFYQLGLMSRTLNLSISSRAESNGEWVKFFGMTHQICQRSFQSLNGRSQTRPFVNMGEEKFGKCHKGNSYFSIQYRIDFTGPINLSRFVCLANTEAFETTVYNPEDACRELEYILPKDYTYSISSPAAL